jgi:hypothetical protein
MSLIIFKFRKLFSTRKEEQTPSEYTSYVILCTILILLFSGIFFLFAMAIIFAVSGSTTFYENIAVCVIWSVVGGSGVTLILRLSMLNKGSSTAVKPVKPKIEYGVIRSIHMEVVEKNAHVGKKGKVHRELFLKDKTGRIINYDEDKKNFNTVFFAVYQDLTYNIEWKFNVYDPSGKKNDYERILKINDKDVDL